jgi:hypothetical protein
MGMTWAAHPNAELRERVASYLGRGYRVVVVDETSAVLWRASRCSRLASLVMNPSALPHFRWNGPDRVRIVVRPDGSVDEVTSGG